MSQHTIHFSVNGRKTDFQPTSLNADWERELNHLGNGEGDAFDYLPLEGLKVLPRLRAQENSRDEQGEYDPMVILKFFTPDTNWTWYVLEGSRQTEDEFLFFGLVCGFEDEFGYFSLSEIKNSKGPLGLSIERDLHFRPQRLSAIQMELIH